MKRRIDFTKTNIVGTIGPASSSVDTLVALIDAGLDVARLNFSHGSHDVHKETVQNIKEASKIAGRPLAILADLCGPKIRLGEIKEPVEVKKGDKITITTEAVSDGDSRIPTIYENLAKDVNSGDIILIDDGLIRLTVDESKGHDILCVVENDGIIKSRKGINLPNVKVSISSITEKDRADIDFIVQQDIDFIALSFVRSADDIKELKWILKDRKKNIPTVAKVEKPEAIENLDAIIDETDIVMVARGDLGVEMKTEEVPVLQKMIIEKCISANTPVITATQMLESMVKNPRPTRAEASDVANAVYDGTDAVMLSAETSVGSYPVETVRTMNEIARTVEERPNKIRRIVKRRADGQLSDPENICRSACLMAEQAEAAAIIAITKGGTTARRLSRFRPTVPVVAFTESESVARSLNIVWGVRGEVIQQVADTDTTLKIAKELAVELGYLKKGDKVVFTAGIPLIESSFTNMVKLDIV